MPNYSQNPRVRALQEAILTGSSSNCLGGGEGFGNHKVRRLGVNASARFRRSYGEIGDSEHSIISVIIDLPNCFITLAKGSCNKNSHFFRFRKFRRFPSSVVPRSAVPQISPTPLVCIQNSLSSS